MGRFYDGRSRLLSLGHDGIHRDLQPATKVMHPVV